MKPLSYLRLIATALLCAGSLAAQISVKDALAELDPKEIRLGEDEPGCKDTVLVARLTGCNIIQCTTKEYDAIDMQVGATADGAAQTEVADGSSEVLYYLCPGKLSPSTIAKQNESALTKSGFKLVFNGKDNDEFPVVTLNKEDQWVQVSTYVYNTYSAYVVSAVKLAPEPPVTAEGMADELQGAGKFLLTGVGFKGETPELSGDSDKMLAELAGALAKYADLKVRIEVHTDDLEGPQTSQEITEKRAASLVAWLEQHGVAKDRLAGEGHGSSKPLAGNDSEDGRAKNRRIEVRRLDTRASN
jgi:outer membrane protein OmpA-like peptidoglycan-associated protein